MNNVVSDIIVTSFVLDGRMSDDDDDIGSEEEDFVVAIVVNNCKTDCERQQFESN